jgi:acylglycerol lipase
MAIQHAESWFRGKGNTRLYRQNWLPDRDIRAVVLVVHGLFDHSGRYRNLVEYLVPRGFAVSSFDQRGHGKSDGLRGYVNRFGDFLDDLDAFRQAVGHEYADKPLFLFGHSAGGLIVIAYVAGHQEGVAGCILSAPTTQPGSSVTRTSIVVARLLSALVPKMGVARLDASGISRDQKVVDDYLRDPLVYGGKIRARLGAELIDTMEKSLPAKMAEIELPILTMHGSADRLSNTTGSSLLHQSVKSKDKTLKYYEGFYHEILNEPGRDQVLADIGLWLDRHV